MNDLNVTNNSLSEELKSKDVIITNLHGEVSQAEDRLSDNKGALVISKNETESLLLHMKALKEEISSFNLSQQEKDDLKMKINSLESDKSENEADLGKSRQETLDLQVKYNKLVGDLDDLVASKEFRMQQQLPDNPSSMNTASNRSRMNSRRVLAPKGIDVNRAVMASKTRSTNDNDYAIYDDDDDDDDDNLNEERKKNVEAFRQKRGTIVTNKGRVGGGRASMVQTGPSQNSKTTPSFSLHDQKQNYQPGNAVMMKELNEKIYQKDKEIYTLTMSIHGFENSVENLKIENEKLTRKCHVSEREYKDQIHTANSTADAALKETIVLKQKLGDHLEKYDKLAMKQRFTIVNRTVEATADLYNEHKNNNDREAYLLREEQLRLAVSNRLENAETQTTLKTFKDQGSGTSLTLSSTSSTQTDSQPGTDTWQEK